MLDKRASLATPTIGNFTCGGAGKQDRNLSWKLEQLPAASGVPATHSLQKKLLGLGFVSGNDTALLHTVAPSPVDKPCRSSHAAQLDRGTFPCRSVNTVDKLWSRELIAREGV